MKVLVQGHLLAVGLTDRSELLHELPVLVVTAESAAEAVRSLKNERFDSIVSRWNLVDMPNGGFQKRLRAVKPDVATVVLISPDKPDLEIATRSIGVSAVLTEDCSDEILIQTLAAILGVEVPVAATLVAAEASRK